MSILDDLRFGARLFLRNRGFTSVVVVTSAVGVAACTVVFSIVNAVLYSPFDAYRDPGRLVFIYEQNPRLNPACRRSLRERTSRASS